MEKQLGNNWEPMIGQKVIALKSNHNPVYPILKSKEYEVVGKFCCCICGQWLLAVKECPVLDNSICVIECCGVETEVSTRFVGGPSKYFAPVQPLYNSALSEILSNFKADEKGGTVDVPVKEIQTA